MCTVQRPIFCVHFKESTRLKLPDLGLRRTTLPVLIRKPLKGKTDGKTDILHIIILKCATLITISLTMNTAWGQLNATICTEKPLSKKEPHICASHDLGFMEKTVHLTKTNTNGRLS